MGGKTMIIRNIYHVPDLRLPLFSLHVHRRVPGCGYHSNKYGVFCFFSTFHMAVDGNVYTYVSCHSTGHNTTKVFDYIQPCASAKSAAAGSVPHRSTCLNPPPPAPTPSMPPPADLPAIPGTEEEWEYDDDVELDVDVPEAAPMAHTAPKPTSQ